MDRNEGLLQRRKTYPSNNPLHESSDDFSNGELKQTNVIDLTLMEEVYLLGLKDRAGHTSFWNDCLSSGLRGCILAELGFKGRIELEKNGMRHKHLLTRKVLVKNVTCTGDVLLDESLRHLKDTNPPDTMQNWIEYLSGESWNPLKLRYHMRYVRERIAKNLVEKGVLTTEKQNFIFFDMTIHPLVDGITKSRVIKKVQDALCSGWINDAQRMDQKTLALIYLAHGSDVLQNALADLNNDDYEVASRRLKELLNLDFEAQCNLNKSNEILWAVISALSK